MFMSTCGQVVCLYLNRGVCVPVVRCVCVRQKRDHSVAEAFTQRTQELSILNVIAGVASQTLLSSLLLQLHSLKVPENTHEFISAVFVDLFPSKPWFSILWPQYQGPEEEVMSHAR